MAATGSSPGVQQQQGTPEATTGSSSGVQQQQQDRTPIISQPQPTVSEPGSGSSSGGPSTPMTVPPILPPLPQSQPSALTRSATGPAGQQPQLQPGQPQLHPGQQPGTATARAAAGHAAPHPAAAVVRDPSQQQQQLQPGTATARAAAVVRDPTQQLPQQPLDLAPDARRQFSAPAPASEPAASWPAPREPSRLSQASRQHSNTATQQADQGLGQGGQQSQGGQGGQQSQGGQGNQQSQGGQGGQQGQGGQGGQERRAFTDDTASRPSSRAPPSRPSPLTSHTPLEPPVAKLLPPTAPSPPELSFSDQASGQPAVRARARPPPNEQAPSAPKPAVKVQRNAGSKGLPSSSSSSAQPQLARQAQRQSSQGGKPPPASPFGDHDVQHTPGVEAHVTHLETRHLNARGMDVQPSPQPRLLPPPGPQPPRARLDPPARGSGLPGGPDDAEGWGQRTALPQGGGGAGA